MARLTPLAKGLIAITILAVAGAAAWHLALKEVFLGEKPAAPDERADAGTDKATAPSTGGSGPLGSASNPLKVSLVSFHGYAPALVANGNALLTREGSIYAQKGVTIEFLIQDDIPTLSTIFGSNTAHCAWRTSDFWAQEQPNLRNAGYDGRAVVVVDNTQGGDAVIARDSSIGRIEDLAGKSVALLQYTPSHGMLIDAVDNSSLSARKKESIRYVFVNADEGTAGVAAAFKAGHVDAAVLWDPDLSLALAGTPGAHVVYSTKTATNLIFDVIVCDKRVLDDPSNEPAIAAFVAGWLEGVEVANKNPAQAVDALLATEPFFDQLAKDQGREFVQGLFANLVWTGLDENARILGLAGGTNHYERVYARFDEVYRRLGALANPNSPVIPPQDSFDYRFVQRLLTENPTARQVAAEPAFTFSASEAREAATREARLTKPVTVSFAPGSAELTKRSQKTIDDEMVPLIESNGSAYFTVSGNTDSTGSRAINMKLSKQRAEAVVKYLVEQWEFPRERFTVVGNGPDQPLCPESNPAAEGLSLDDCRAMNRTTRLAVLAR